jgi:hypothetical protein
MGVFMATSVTHNPKPILKVHLVQSYLDSGRAEKVLRENEKL